MCDNQPRSTLLIPLYTVSSFYTCPYLQCLPSCFYYHFHIFHISNFTFFKLSILPILLHSFPFPIFQISILPIFLIFSHFLFSKFPGIFRLHISQVPEVLNVHMNEIYRKLTTIKLNKLRFKKVLNKITFSCSKVNFSLQN